MFFQRLVLISMITFLLIGCTGNTPFKDTKAITQTSQNTRITQASISHTVKPTDTGKPTITLTPSSTTTPSQTIVPSPTITPTPIGGSSPLIAYSLYDRVTGENQVKIIQLQPEKTVSVIPWNYPLTPDQSTYMFSHPIAFSQDGTLLAYGNGREAEKKISIYNLKTGEIESVIQIGNTQDLETLGWSPDSNWLMYMCWENKNRTPYIWIFHRPSKKLTKVGAGSSNGTWTKDNQLLYKNNSGQELKLDPSTLEIEKLNIPKRSKLLGNIFSNWSIRHLRELNSALIIGKSKKDESIYYVLISLETNDETLLAHVAADNKSFSRHSIKKILPSPDGNYYLIFNEVDTYDENEKFTGKKKSSYLVHKDELPLTGNEKSLDLFPLEWAPDSSAFLAYKPYKSKEDIDDQLLFMRINNLDEPENYLLTNSVWGLWPTITYRHDYLGIDVFWSSKPSTFSVQAYHTPTPTPTKTLEPGVTPSSTPSPLHPLIENIQNAIPVQEINLTSYKQQWDFNNVQLDNKNIIVNGSSVLGSSSWDAYLDYPRFDIVANTGVLVKFKAERRSNGMITLMRGEWDTSTYRLWGILKGLSGTEPLVFKGTDHSAEPDMTNEINVIGDIWYYLFLGVDENNNFIQLMWNPETPSDYHLGYYNYGDLKDAPYHFHVGGNIGNITINEVIFYNFEGYKK